MPPSEIIPVDINNAFVTIYMDTQISVRIGFKDSLTRDRMGATYLKTGMKDLFPLQAGRDRNDPDENL